MRFPVALLAVLLSAVPAAQAQEMEPKSYSASPVGANFLVGAYSWSHGAVVFDPTLPISDVKADVQAFVIGTGHTFGMFGKLALASVAFPYSWADVSGRVQEQAASVTRSGLADARLKLSVNLRGNPALSAREFVRAPRRTVVGASLLASAPAGQYYGDKLINLGANRWAFKPEVGFSAPAGRWDLDGYLGVWLFTANPHFYPGEVHRSQRPMVAAQGHVSYTLRSRLWVAADGTWYSGGKTRANDGEQSLGVSNTRLGLTFSAPVGRRYSVKVSYGSGVVVRTGTNFNSLTVAWQALWLSPKWSRGSP